MDIENFPVDEIYRYWFAECVEKPDTLTSQARLWFTANDLADFEIKRSFGYLFAGLVSMPGSALTGARSALTAILLLDQFSRKAFRSTPRAYEFDQQALRMMDFALEKGWDSHLHAIEKAFLLMPLQHSESLRRQKQASQVFNELVLGSREPYREYLMGLVKFARQRRMLVERFGRFPERNIILKRISTDEEESYLRHERQNLGQKLKV